MDFRECEEKGLVRKSADAREWAAKELENAGMFLEQSEKVLNAKAYESAEIIAYSSLFHSARALLFSRGYVEKSHYCLLIAIMSLYEGEIREIFKEANYIREARHDALYSGMRVAPEKARHAIDIARKAYEICKKGVWRKS